MEAAVIVIVAVFAALLIAFAALVGFTAFIARSVERTDPPLGPWIDVDGNRLQYIDEGEGPPIVMIHGLGGQLRHFTYGIVDRLKGDFRVIAFDRPGSGYSTRARGASARLRAQGDVIAHAIQRLGLKAPLVVGHSLGGGVALAIALDHPDCVGGLALLSPVAQAVSTPPSPFKGLVIRSPFVRWLMAWTVATPLGMREADDVLASVFKPDPVPSDFPVRGGGILGLRPSAFAYASADLMESNADFRAMIKRYAELNLPVSILYGREDNILDFRKHGVATSEAIPSAQLTLIDGGHMLPIVAAETAAAFIASAARNLPV